jgi:hypothetical protein
VNSPAQPTGSAPDPRRLGGLEWTRKTQGHLSPSERRRLLAAIALGQWQNLLGRAKLALRHTTRRAEEVDLETFLAPDSRLARQAEEAATEQTPAILAHSYRTWFFGRALSAVDVVDLDIELYLLRRTVA